MRTLIIILCIFFVVTVKGQAHLGSTEYEIKAFHPENKWTTGYTNSGGKFISSDMIYGTFTYYFDTETKLSDYNIQIPFNLTTLNGQVEAYNKKYVITSETSWTAYLENGGMIYIKLIYNEELKIRYFSYRSTK
ncbi:MAG: hypothetical protein IPP81_19105 [Chitinophagaceae bacterium]|nr:hypothetical protein [Chitinophagaceae bacterium]